MPNPSPMGAFAQGVAGGIQGGMQNYLLLTMKRIDQQQRQAEISAEYNYKLFSNPTLPTAIRKKAWKAWQKVGKDWNTGIESPDFADDMFDNKEFNEFAKRGVKIITNKDFSLQERRDFLIELHAEAMAKLGSGKATGVEPLIKSVEQKAFAKGTAELGKGPMTPKTRGLLAMSPSGRDILTEHAKPAPLPKQPAIPMYQEKDIGEGQTQKFRWNPKTKKHDIAYGQPVKPKEQTVFKTLGGNIYKITGDKSTMVQKGSMEAKAIYNAMREPQYSFLSPPEQYELFEKHLKFLTGDYKKPKAPAGTGGKILPRTKGETISEYEKRTGL